MDDPVANNSNQHDDGPRETSVQKPSDALSRRRLLKGAMAAAPAVFTLQSGAARAAVSGYQACYEKMPEFNPSSQYGYHINKNKYSIESESATKWVRREEHSGMKIVNPAPMTGMKARYWLLPSETSSMGSEYMDQKGNTWVHVLSGSNPHGTGDGYVLKEKLLWLPESPALLYTLDKSYLTRYRVVAVDDYGNLQPMGTHGTNPVTVSCWTSFMSTDSGGGTGGSWWNYWW